MKQNEPTHYPKSKHCIKTIKKVKSPLIYNTTNLQAPHISQPNTTADNLANRNNASDKHCRPNDLIQANRLEQQLDSPAPFNGF